MHIVWKNGFLCEERSGAVRFTGNISRNPKGKEFLLIFFAGFLLGILFGCMYGKDYRDYAGILSEYYLNRYKYMELNEDRLFFYLLAERLPDVIMLLLFSFTNLRKIVFSGYLGWMGFSAGTILTISVIRFGSKGILLCLAGMIPQYFFYILVLILTVTKIFSGGNIPLVGIVVHYFGVFILLVAGIMLETWVNPLFLKLFLKFL